MPPDSSDGNLSPSRPLRVRPSRAWRSPFRRAAGRRDRRFSRIGNWTFWRTVSEENSAPCWNRMPQRRAIARVPAGRAVRAHGQELDAALPLRNQTDDGAQQHRLAAAGRADDAEDLAAPDVERQMIEHDAARRSRPRDRGPGSPPGRPVRPSAVTSRSRRRRSRTRRRAR